MPTSFSSSPTFSTQTSISTRSALLLGGDRPRMLGELLIGYFRREGSLLKGKDSVHNISSDVIESSFGYLKSRMSSCANHGFTSLILVMPLHFKLADLEGCAKFDIRGHLTETSLTKLAKWKVESLMPNLAIRRSMMLKIASYFLFNLTA